MKRFAPLFFLMIGLAALPVHGQATRPVASISPATAPATKPAEVSAFFRELSDEYMKGQWDKAGIALKDTATIATLSKAEQEDVTYIRTAIAECRPDWWDKVKAGNPTKFQVNIWDQKVEVNYKNGAYGFQHVAAPNGTALNVSWPNGPMDSMAPYVDPNGGNTAGFTIGERARMDFWHYLEAARQYTQVMKQNIPNPPQAKQFQNTVFSYFHFRAVGIYYGTPRSRAFGMADAMLTFDTVYSDSAGYLGSRAIAVALLDDMLMHKERYPSFHFPKMRLSSEGDLGAEGGDFARATRDDFVKFQYTFAEDKAIRALIKSVVAANSDLKAGIGTGAITLPMGQVIYTDPHMENEAQLPRWQWQSQFLHFNTLANPQPVIVASRGRGTYSSPPRAGAAKPLTPATTETKPSGFYAEITSLYMKGDWDQLDIRLRETAAVAALNMEQQDNVAYIRAAMADGRPEWWKTMTAGGASTLKIILWKKPFDLKFKDDAMFNLTNAAVPSATWPVSLLEDSSPIDTPHQTFTRREAVNEVVWRMAESARLLSEKSRERKTPSSVEDASNFAVYRIMREGITAAYYAKPRERAWMYYLAMGLINPVVDNDPSLGTRSPLAWALLADMAENPTRYPTFHFSQAYQMSGLGPIDMNWIRAYFQPTSKDFDEFKYTFEEDKVLRGLAKNLGDSTLDMAATLKSKAIKLPNGMAIEMGVEPTPSTDKLRKSIVDTLKKGPLASVSTGSPTPPPTANRGAATTLPAGPGPRGRANTQPARGPRP